ncbi:EAL domain-containing protein [Roseibium sp. HPY-6]|uniref:EAL domain-containing protein n=1 Tax=Roseibium sp. HPY-6 TaxID=3229852 RepID=UPI00338E0861
MKNNSAVLLFFISILSTNYSFAEVKRSVLAIHSYNSEHVWTGMLKDGIDTTFADDNNTRLFHEYLDAKRFPDQLHADAFFEYLIGKYATTQPDLVMVSDDVGLQTLLTHRDGWLADVPVVFMGINQVSQSLIDLPRTTGVFENRNITATVLDIRAITAKDELIVISDREAAGSANLSKAKEAADHEKAPDKIHFIEEIFKRDAVQQLSRFPADAPILLVGQIIDGDAGNALIGWREGTALLSSQLPNPVFTIAIISMKHGSLGAHNLDGVLHGAQAANLAKQILSGTPADDVPDLVNAESLWILDWQLMKKLGYTENPFPATAQIVNNDESFYQKYRYLVWSTSLAFAIAILIILLLVEIIRRGNRTRDILIENEERYKDLAQVGSIAFWETDADDRVRYASNNFTPLMGIQPSELVGRPIIDLVNLDPRIEFPVEETKRLMRAHRPVKNLSFNVHSSAKDLQIYLLNATVATDKSGGFAGYRGVLREVTQEHQISQELAYLAAFDSVTGLENRTSFFKKLKDTAGMPSKSAAPVWVCFLDLDRFKTVNDTAGHLVGDAMLVEVAKVIGNCLGDGDQIGRLGGDEFGLILGARSPSDVKVTCDSIVKAVGGYHFQWQDRLFSVGVSIGAVPIIDGLTETELLSKADLACYKAKEAGRGRVYLTDFDHGDLYDEEREMGYIANVSQALSQDRFFLVKQPICPPEHGGTDAKHYEFLLRYKDEHGNLISPSVFVPAAEKHGVIGLIDRWVVERVFMCYEDYFPDEDVLVSINLSGISLSSEEFVDEIELLLKNSAVKPENICFEITETAAISQLSQALTFIEQMKKHGIKFALDDFGSGTSSFGYLKQLPIDYVKIDGSLVRNILIEETDLAIVKAINSIAHLMHMKTIAEFVETDEIRTLLAGIGVDYVQGHAVGRPT